MIRCFVVFHWVNTLSFPLIVLDCHGESICNSDSCCSILKLYLRRDGLSACPHWALELSVHRRLVVSLHVGPFSGAFRAHCSANSRVSQVDSSCPACLIGRSSSGQYLYTTVDQHFGPTRAVAFYGRKSRAVAY